MLAQAPQPPGGLGVDGVGRTPTFPSAPAAGSGAFTFGDLFRHLAGLERFMYAGNVQGRPSTYLGHGVRLAAGLNISPESEAA
jgi:hypothetical protein